MRKKITEYIAVDLDKEVWVCEKCDHELNSAHENYKKGCLIYDRDPSEIHQPHVEGDYTFSPDANWVRLVEFYCPGCGTLVETEVLAPGHPITHDIQVDLEALKQKAVEEEKQQLKVFKNV
ncbi:acetone carboxylase subunit gamma [Bacillus timonensis]|uniref:acetone carboxylase subunit gamma n=1 Tax=Bacillus timonensis TaxID=1033734 RepID=UPI0002885FF7|nr:acetone carboxylase subunit gamma [Bacillus timonensis]